MRRRTVLESVATGTCGVGTVGLSGCLRRVGSEALPKDGCPDTASRTPCEGSWQRIGAYTSSGVRDGNGAGFELTASSERLSVGDCVRFRLVNRSGETKLTGNDEKIDVHRRTERGWRSVLFSRQRTFTDEGVSHEPGAGFDWHLRFARGGVVAGSERARLCGSLAPGRYRFVYWGVSGEDFDALGVRFDVRE